MATPRLVPAILAPLLLPVLPGQCPLSWVPDWGVTAGPFAIAKLPNDDVLVSAGGFAGLLPAQMLARFDGSTWTAFGPPIVGFVTPRDLEVLPNGDVIVAGIIPSMGGTLVNNIARWNGTSWQALGPGLPNSGGGSFLFPGYPGVSVVDSMPNGDVVAAYPSGDPYNAPGAMVGVVERWNGSTWQQLGALGLRFPAALLPHPNDHLTMSGLGAPEVATWNGNAWVPVGSMLPAVPPWASTAPRGSALAELPNGDVVVGGRFTQINPGGAGPNIARWDGTTWNSLASGVNGDVTSLTVLPNGDLFVTGEFSSAGGVPVVRTARWDGTTWSAMPGTQEAITAAVLTGAHLACIGGYFDMFGGVVNENFARLATACPGGVTVLGSGCAGQLQAPLPWVGTTWTSTGTQLPPQAFVVRGFGFTTQAVPLSAVFPQAGPGCDLLISPDVVDVVRSANGTVATDVSIPNVPALAGSVFHHQLVPFVVDAALNIVSVTSTPALTLTVGML